MMFPEIQTAADRMAADPALDPTAKKLAELVRALAARCELLELQLAKAAVETDELRKSGAVKWS